MSAEVFCLLKSKENATQLFCFPYLGGHANVFLDFAKAVTYDIEIWSANLPGHGGLDGALLEDIKTVVDFYYEKLSNLIKGPYVLFGHSMGAIIAYFLAQRIFSDENCLIKPSALILSACNVPESFLEKTYSTYSDSDLMKHISSFNESIHELSEAQDLLAYLLPIFRADFKILESSAQCKINSPLEVPVYFLWGENDPLVQINTATEWLNYFASPINFVPIANGCHMFIHKQPEVFIKTMYDIVTEVIKVKD